MELYDQALINYAESSSENKVRVFEDAYKMYEEIQYSPYRFEWAVRMGKVYTLRLLIEKEPQKDLRFLIPLAEKSNNPATAELLRVAVGEADMMNELNQRFLQTFTLQDIPSDNPIVGKVRSIKPITTFESIPSDVLQHMSSFLDPVSRRRFRQTNTKIRRLLPFERPPPPKIYHQDEYRLGDYENLYEDFDDEDAWYNY